MIKNLKLVSLFAYVFVSASLCLGFSESRDTMFPFYLPWDDSEKTFFDLSYLNHKPAGKHGYIKAGPDGHFYEGNKRIKFFGVNITGEIPNKTIAEKTAKHLAKYGVNVARFHLMDFHIFDAGKYGNTRSLREDFLDKLDYFVAKLKENGIYSNINLLCGRYFLPSDGLPESIRNYEWKQQDAIACFNKNMIELQKEYAKNLLDRINPYTELSYLNDPAVAFVEINNENGIIMGWLYGIFDDLSKGLSANIEKEWNDFLKNKYKTHKKLKETWTISAPIENEILINNDFSEGIRSWIIEQHDAAKLSHRITANGPDGAKAIKLNIENIGMAGWHIQFNQHGLELYKDIPYTLTFWAKADKKSNIDVAVNQAHHPWKSLGFVKRIELSDSWQRYEHTFVLGNSDDNARLSFLNMCSKKSTYCFSKISLKKGGEIGISKNENLDNNSVKLIFVREAGNKTSKAMKDWVSFLTKKEQEYWGGINQYLKDELNGKFLVCGTIVGCSTPNLMNELDYIDAHAYWQHPSFPDKPWDSKNWNIKNSTLTEDPICESITNLAIKRVYGKPFSVSEYDHPFPNTFSGEAYIFLGSYAAFQDWDALYGFSYGDEGAKYIKGFFYLGQNTPKFMNYIPAAYMYRRGDVSSSDKTVSVKMTYQDEINVISGLGSFTWDLINATDMGLERETSLLYKTCIIPENKDAPVSFYRPKDVNIPLNRRYIADTNEISLSPKEGVLKINTPLSKAVAGFTEGNEYNLDGILIRPIKSLQKWSIITLTGFETDNLRNPPCRILLTASGSVRNSGGSWIIYPDTKTTFPPPKDEIITLKNNPGWPPVLCEGIGAEIVLPYPKKKVSAYALDNKGLRKEKVKVKSEKGNAKIVISEKYKTLWYEIEVK